MTAPRATVLPTPRAVLAFTAGIAVACLPALFGARLTLAWAGAFTFLVLLLAADALLALPASRLRVEALFPESIALGGGGAGASLEVRVAGPASHAGLFLEALLDAGGRIVPPGEARFALGEDGSAAIAFPLVPVRRGQGEIRALSLRWRGPLAFVSKVARVPLSATIPIETDLAPVRATALRFAGSPEFRSGQKTERYLGDGSEFDSLRDYVPGFDLRSLDWKASARHRRLLSREYRAERNHPVMVAIDSGRLMCEPLEGVAKIDRAIGAALELAFVAQKTGDRIGLYSFDERPRLFAPPEAGMAAFRRVRRLSADVEYTVAETNFTLGLSTLASKLPRRSLVVVFTDFVDSVSAEIMAENLDRMARRHLVLFVALRDPLLDAIENAPIASAGDLHRALVARDFARERRLVLERLRRSGVLVVDAVAEAASARLLNRYLEVRRREAI